MFGIGPVELIIVLLILLVLFGASRLPEMGRSLGSGMRGFKDELITPSADEPPSADPLPRATERDATSVPTARSVHDS
jgi:sec-independent protein translocase protein TatA